MISVNTLESGTAGYAAARGGYNVDPVVLRNRVLVALFAFVVAGSVNAGLSRSSPTTMAKPLLVVVRHARRDQVSHLINDAPLSKESLLKEPPTSLSELKLPRTDATLRE